ncbi:MAG: nuclease [Betaproteobacteria bacterium]|nr:nuclease [Betaproteobacteria bacterium]
MTSEILHIVADDREANSGVIDALKRHPQCSVRIARMRLGDYQVSGRLLFERKTLRDLVESIIDGRFLNQARRLSANPLRPVILLEGTARDIAGCGMTREAIHGALVSAAIVFGIPLLRSRDPEESAMLMLFAARQTQEGIAGALPRPGFRPKSKRGLQLHILQSLPSIGPVRARRLIDRFETIESVVSAMPEELANVEGIGPILARKIRWSVCEPTAKYLVFASDRAGRCGNSANAGRTPGGSLIFSMCGTI